VNSESSDALLRSYVLRRYREERSTHLASCPSTRVTEFDASDGSYGCDTGCEYVRLEATIACVHGAAEEFTWGTFGELAYLIEDVEKEARRLDAGQQS
jgi:hypothetical protein